MFEYTARHFEDLCRDPDVLTEIGAIEEKRRRAVGRFWMLLALTIALAVAAFGSLIASGWNVTGVIVGLVVLIGGIVVATRPMAQAKEDLKLPVLETLARNGGMEYLPSGFDPPVYPSAARILFGRVTGHVFTDLFHGTDAEGRRFAVYEGTLTQRSGKNTVTVFTGQMYAYQRRTTGKGETAAVPDKGLFNFFKPSGMERVKFEADPEFEKKFEVYATEPAQASMLVGSDVRRGLLELRQAGRTFVYVGPEDVLVAIWGSNRFEPGSMFRARAGQERVRMMFDDVCAAMATLRKVKTLLD